MINFRYHVVSLTAVFLALAIGLVVGTAALNGPVADSLKDTITALSKDNSNYRDQANQYRDELNRASGFATEVATPLLSGKLTGRRVALIALPTGADSLSGVAAMLKISGVKITATVTVLDKFFDPTNEVELLALASASSQPTIPTSALPTNSDGVETSSALLALGLLERTPAVSTTDLGALLTAYSKQGDITVDQGAVGGAEAVVIVSGSPAIDKDAAKKAQSAVTFADQFRKNRPLVVAGTGIGDGNLVSLIRADPTLVQQISTVDNVTSVQGQLSTALTLVERMTTNKVGQYGLQAGASSMVPKVAA